MLYVVLADETLEKVEGAVKAAVEGDHLVCRDEAGAVVKTYFHLDVLLYGSLESLSRAVPMDGASST